MNEILSRIISELSVKSEGGEELSSKIHRLRDELKSIIENEDTLFGKLSGLAESLREVIPDEKPRYHAVVAAVSMTTKLSRQEIIGALANQLEEFKILEKGLLSSLPGRDELTAMEARSRDKRDEIAKLREKIGQLESEEKGILNDMAAREKEAGLVEKTVGELFTDIGAGIAGLKEKIEAFTADSAVSQKDRSGDSISFGKEKSEAGQKSEIRASSALRELPMSSGKKKIEAFTADSEVSQPVPPGDAVFPIEEKGGGEQAGETRGPSAPQDTEFQKKCPMCGGRMDFLIMDKKWMCYSCAFEEAGEAQGNSPGKSEVRGPSAPEQSLDPSSPQDTEFQKKCPMCGGRMDFTLAEKKWMCYSCAFEEKE